MIKKLLLETNRKSFIYECDCFHRTIPSLQTKFGQFLRKIRISTGDEISFLLSGSINIMFMQFVVR